MTSPPQLPPDFCPYAGLAPYTTEIHGNFFFGRETDQKIVLSSLYAVPLTIFYGVSGVGKSSLLMAKVVPELAQTAHAIVVLHRDWQSSNFMGDLKKAVLRTVRQSLGQDAEAAQSSLEAVVHRLDDKAAREKAKLQRIREVANQEAEPEEESNTWLEQDDVEQEIDEKLHEEKVGVLSVIEVLKVFYIDENRPDLTRLPFDELLQRCAFIINGVIFLIFDQFEEYFLYHSPSAADDGFEAEFARAVNRQEVPASFLLSMREEELSKLDRFRRRILNLFGNVVRLQHLERKAAETAIRLPLAEYNKSVEATLQMQIEDRLVEAVLNRASQAPPDERGEGSVRWSELDRQPVELAVLQMLMKSVWEEEKRAGSNTLCHSTLSVTLGGPDTIVRSYVERAMRGLQQAQRVTAAELFQYLVTPSGTKHAYTMADLQDLTRQPPSLVKSTLNALLDTKEIKILRKEGEHYELFHDVLGKAVIDWQRGVEARREHRRKRHIYALWALLFLLFGVVLILYNRERITKDLQTALAQQAAQQRLAAEQQAADARVAAAQYEQQAADARVAAAQYLQERDSALRQLTVILSPPPRTGLPTRRAGEHRRSAMFGSTVLEVAIGMVFIYLLLSLLCSAMSELIEAQLKFRARYLVVGIRNLLSDPYGEGLAKDFFEHPLIKGLRVKGGQPSYIPTRTFALALWNIATSAGTEASGVAVTHQLSSIRETINKLSNKDLRSALLTLIDEAGNDISKARKNIEEWYDDAMDRVSGLYKRHTQYILLLLGVMLAMAVNADSINIATALAHNSALRESIVAVAEDYARTPLSAGSPQTPEQKIRDIRGQINQLGFPLGWVSKPMREDPQGFPHTSTDWWLKVLGWLLTALAISQGAPFWFDLLNKFIVVRSTIKPREKSPEQPSKDESNRTKGGKVSL